MYKPESRFPTQAEPQDTQRQIKIWDQDFWFEFYYYCICIAFYYFNFSFSENFITHSSMNLTFHCDIYGDILLYK